MNSELMRWLLNLRVIPADAEAVHLAFERPWPGWAWAMMVIVAAAFAVWSYSHMAGKRPYRALLSGLRFLVIIFVLFIISGPVLEMPRETVEQDWVLVLADRSESLRIADVQRVSERVSRDEQLRSILNENRPAFDAIGKEREVVWLGFHVGAFGLGPPGGEPSSEPDDARSDAGDSHVDLGLADGARTALGMSIEQALQRAAGRPLSGIVVLSDGRTYDRPSQSLLRRLAADDVRVFTVPLGSSDPLADMAIRRVDSPRRAFIRDKVPVTVQVDRLGEAGGANMSAVVRLIDTLSGEELAREELLPGDDRDEVTLIAEPHLAGSATWRVEIETDQPALVPENTVLNFAIDLIDRPLRVLYVDGYPRWEFRYLKNLLIRESTIESSIMLLSADRDFAQEGDVPLTRLPRSPGEFAEFDVIVLGDVPASYFTAEQLDMMRDQVAERGAGFLWIGGERNTPASYQGTVLADLLPMRSPLALQRITSPVLMQPTYLAERLGVMQLLTGADGDSDAGWPEELMDASFGWSQLRWAQRIDSERLKPTAEVLAQTVYPVDGSNLPLVLIMRYGAGRSMYVATDEIWRWRYGRGELLPEQFWMQLLRMLGRDSLGGGELAVLEAGPRRVQVQQPVRLVLQLFDEQLAENRRQSVAAVIENEAGEAITEIELARQSETDERYAATFLPDSPGNLRVRLTEPSLVALDLETPVEVFAPDDELRQPETDHELLADISRATGGRMLQPDELSELPNLLPNRQIVTVNPLRERIWDTPLFFVLLVLFLTLEWVGRKVLRLI